jgi:hypothetical protein
MDDLLTSFCGRDSIRDMAAWSKVFAKDFTDSQRNFIIEAYHKAVSSKNGFRHRSLSLVKFMRAFASVIVFASELKLLNANEYLFGNLSERS